MGMDLDKEEYVQRYILPEKRASAFAKNKNLTWPQQNIALGQYLIYGPFDFLSQKPPAYLAPGPTEPHRIHNTHWCALEDRAKSLQLDISKLRTRPTPQS